MKLFLSGGDDFSSGARSELGRDGSEEKLEHIEGDGVYIVAVKTNRPKDFGPDCP